MSRGAIFRGLHVGVRVIHRHYGRGTVARVFESNGQVNVTFDDGDARRVMVRDLVRLPADMPPAIVRRVKLGE